MITLTLKLESSALEVIARTMADVLKEALTSKQALAVIVATLNRIEAAISANHKESITTMSQVSIRLDRLDADSNMLAAAFKALRDKLASGEPATPEELARFDAGLAALEAMGADPAQPQPPIELP
jgi:hypothetical protein